MHACVLSLVNSFNNIHGGPTFYVPSSVIVAKEIAVNKQITFPTGWR